VGLSASSLLEWCGVRNSVLAETGCLGSLGELWGCRGRALGGMVGLASASEELGGMECAVVRLVTGVHWACGKWQLWGSRCMALGGVGWDEVHALCWVAWTAQPGEVKGGAQLPVGIQGSGRSPSATPVLPAPTGFSAGSEHVKRAADTNIARTRTPGVAHTSMMPYFVDLQTHIAASATASGLLSRFLSKWLPGW
jgi:hypothetical protein